MSRTLSATARGVLGAGLVLAAVAAVGVPGRPAPSALPPARPTAAADPVVTVTGHGYGHGRGLGQWGALGYAVDQGWSSGQILDHYYGGTRAATVPNLPISVELLAQRGRGAIVTAPGLKVNGALVGAGAVLVARTGPGTFTVQTGPGCAGPWTTWGTAPSGVVVSSADAPQVELCEADRIRGYRGDLQLVERTDGASALVNRLAVEDYLRGVVPRESSASWADLGGGRGAQALQAQAVAARSYVLAAPYASYATACDTTSCQVYSGAWTRPFSSATRTSLDDPRSDAAVRSTAGLVRAGADGRTARTEFSASTGGWTAGGAFPAVEDTGDAYAGNPQHTWTVTFTFADLANRLGLPDLTGLRVTARNGLGQDGGRAVQVVADTGHGPVTLSGNDVRLRLGLKSDWYSFTTTSYAEAQALVRGLWTDLLDRAPGADELAARSREIAAGRPPADLARDLAGSAERAGHLVDATYAAALLRAPSDAERAGWSSVVLSSGSLLPLRQGIFGSPESRAVNGTAEGWVAQLYRSVLGREAGAGERSGWAAQAAATGTAGVARAIAGSPEALQRRLDTYYGGMLQRVPDAGAAGFLALLQGPGEIGVPTGIGGSAEYRQKVVLRFP